MLDYTEEKRIDDLLARIDALTSAEREELRALHARKRATEPKPVLTLPHSCEAIDLASAVLVVVRDVLEPLGQTMHEVTDLRLALKHGKVSWMTPAQVEEYERAQRFAIDRWRALGQLKHMSEAAIDAKHVHWRALTNNDRWDFMMVAKAAGVRVFDEKRGNFIAGWWLLCVPCPYLLFKWYTTEQAKISAISEWSPWQVQEDRERLATTPIARALLETSQLTASRLGTSLDQIEQFWKRAAEPAKPMRARKVAT